MSGVDPAALTRRWLEDWVIGLELCPFAAPLLRDPALRIAVSAAAEEAGWHRDWLRELDYLQQREEDEVATTLLVLPAGPGNFDKFLDLLELANADLEASGLTGVVQLASFHPSYRFAAEPAGSASHYTNRSPFPTLHLLREAMLSRVLAGFPDPAAIPARNVARLEAMGADTVRRRWQQAFAQH